MNRQVGLSIVTAASIAGLFVTLPLDARQVDGSALEQIKDEGLNRSQVMDIASYLTDVYGPRLTGSPNIKAAGDWAVTTMKGWGLTNVGLEPWQNRRGFDRGWSNDKFYLAAIQPQAFPIAGTPSAWTPGTNGLVRGEVVCVTGTTEAELAQFKGRLKGRFVITAPAPNVQAFFDQPLAVRQTTEQLDRLQAAQPGSGRGGARGGPPPTAGSPAPPPTSPVAPQSQAACATAPAANQAGGRGGGRGAGPGGFNRNDFFRAEGVIATFSTAAIGHGVYTIGGSRDADPARTLPAVTIAAEHYGRIARLIAKGIPVTLEVDIRNTFYPNPPMFNVVGEIPGSDKAGEIVMLGAHFDSWHASTGATDNASGSAAMMEAMRILKTTGVRLRRTVRIGLWTGEEQGLFGSAEYVARHFAACRALTPQETASTGGESAAGAAAGPAPGAGRGGNTIPGRYETTPEYARFAGYFNIDNGTGLIRGVYLQGNESVRPVFKEWMAPLASLGMTHATINNTTGTDHVSFDNVGLPGWQFIQDPIEYGRLTHHTNLDSYERLQADDMKKNATIAAAFAYLAANRDELLPRKTFAGTCTVPAPRGRAGDPQGGQR
ncbi:MAG TPA: M28 family peptidase [Vicinamibacterales bacterium]|nr:M28 family peptidase [Vicinamibacterales bacterium]